ncbi:ferritin-like domain-containing protein [Algoriphagus machipongonensis]|uniref:Iminophenyl-pyruvate dimer synthase domain-containing protein n=1 Tax=Algoriphagus machipongonensis TaxID=388413 RepID=A3HV98_9BACT|nr:ferritin-like protein [Algoriphagus machipongonensis]EAZ82070.1 hypothetical protein ALPR1_02475 [Algoriphagus machipongonensis]
MTQKNHRKIQLAPDLDQKVQNLNDSEKKEFINLIYSLLKQASTTEHLLAMQYLFTSFSLKKYPEEFSDYVPGSLDPGQQRINQIRMAQVEKIRRWEANILMVSREEMGHLCYDMNLLAILGENPYLFRPNFPVPATSFPMEKPVNLMPFSPIAIEIFRYWEKPDHLPVSDPLEASGIPEQMKSLFNIPHKKAKPFDKEATESKAMDFLLDFFAKNLSQDQLNQIHNPLTENTYFNSVEELYTFLQLYLVIALKYQIIEGENFERIVDEHYGFNISLNPLIVGQFVEYVEEAVSQILEEGEGVHGIPPSLGSHFWVFQSILDDLQKEEKVSGLPFDAALPVVWNPTYSIQADRHLIKNIPSLSSNATNQISNQVSVLAMQLFNEAYTLMVKMLSGFFGHYEIDQTTGIRPKQVNAYFQTAFYPFMTNVIRPLGEMICRLPADESFIPDGGKIPERCAGPDFMLDVSQFNQDEIDKMIAPYDQLEDYLERFESMKTKAIDLQNLCKERGYHMAFYLQDDARDFDVSFGYLAENFERMGKNFKAYWNGDMVAPISSRGFQNYSTTFN